MRRGYADGVANPGSENSVMADVLTREDCRRLRAQAWRHIHRLNPAIARMIWRRVRDRERMGLAA